MTDRTSKLLAQARATADRRTDERDRLRAAMPMGLALELLMAQIRRLRRTPCPTMGFDPTTSGVETESLRKEIAELEAEEPGSDAWRGELLDVITCALHMGIAADLRPEDIAGQAAKLGARLDRIDSGGTWEQVKADERVVAAVTHAGPMIVQGVRIPEPVVHDLNEWISSRTRAPFRAGDLAAVALSRMEAADGAHKHPDVRRKWMSNSGPDRVADRLIQAARKAGRIVQLETRGHWLAVIPGKPAIGTIDLLEAQE